MKFFRIFTYTAALMGIVAAAAMATNALGAIAGFITFVVLLYMLDFALAEEK